MKNQDARNSDSHRVQWILGLISFISFVAAHQILGIGAAVKVLGISCIFVGAHWIFRRRVPFGIEGRAPVGEIRGIGAKLAGIALCLVGILMLLYSVQAACFFGWVQDECLNIKW